MSEAPDQHPSSIDWSRLNHGICPRCEEHKFIGHGPLCWDCYRETATL